MFPRPLRFFCLHLLSTCTCAKGKKPWCLLYLLHNCFVLHESYNSPWGIYLKLEIYIYIYMPSSWPSWLGENYSLSCKDMLCSIESKLNHSKRRWTKNFPFISFHVMLGYRLLFVWKNGKGWKRQVLKLSCISWQVECKYVYTSGYPWPSSTVKCKYVYTSGYPWPSSTVKSPVSLNLVHVLVFLCLIKCMLNLWGQHESNQNLWTSYLGLWCLSKSLLGLLSLSPPFNNF